MFSFYFVELVATNSHNSENDNIGIIERIFTLLWTEFSEDKNCSPCPTLMQIFEP